MLPEERPAPPACGRPKRAAASKAKDVLRAVSTGGAPARSDRSGSEGEKKPKAPPNSDLIVPAAAAASAAAVVATAPAPAAAGRVTGALAFLDTQTESCLPFTIVLPDEMKRRSSSGTVAAPTAVQERDSATDTAHECLDQKTDHNNSRAGPSSTGNANEATKRESKIESKKSNSDRPLKSSSGRGNGASNSSSSSSHSTGGGSTVGRVEPRMKQRPVASGAGVARLLERFSLFGGKVRVPSNPTIRDVWKALDNVMVSFPNASCLTLDELVGYARLRRYAGSGRKRRGGKSGLLCCQPRQHAGRGRSSLLYPVRFVQHQVCENVVTRVVSRERSL